MNNLADWANNELKLWNVDNDSFGELMSNDVLEVLEVLCNQGHSGFSSPWLKPWD